MITLVIVLSVLTIVGLIVLGASYYAYKSAFYAKGSKAHVSGYFKKSGSLIPVEEHIQRLTDYLLSEEYEDLYVDAFDGIRLHARLYYTSNDAPVQIFMHGYKGNPFRSMSGLYKIAKDLGHNVLIVDQRGCGKSEGEAVTFGIKEKQDTLTWVEVLQKRFKGTKIFLVGISLGGASVLMANDKDLPPDVVGVIADCPFSSPVQILKKVCRDHGVPSLFFPFVTLGAILFGGFNPYSNSATEAVKSAAAPVLILHGENDGFVPISMAEEIYSACKGEKYIHRFPSADHAICYFVDTKRYETAVTDFTKKCLNK